jgi:dynactin complex subunit
MDYEDLRGENERLKKALEKEIAKRRQVEKNLKTNIVSLSELQRKVREQEINLSNQSKEIRYLEERTYSKEDKIMFSYREKGLLEEIRRLKAAYSSTTGAQFFEKEIRRLTIEYD